MFRLKSLLFTLLISASLSTVAGTFKVDGVDVGKATAIKYITANYEARVIKIVTDGTAHFSRIDTTLDEADLNNNQQQLVVDDVVIGTSDLITWFLINPNNNSVRLVTNGNLDISVDVPARDPQITNFKANKGTITEGDTVTLTWSSTDTDYCKAGGDFILAGQLSTDGSESFVEATVGSRDYQLTCYADSEAETFTDTSSVSVTVESAGGSGGGGDPGIESFTASSITIAQGEPITLSWRANDVNFCEGKVDFALDSTTDKMPINSSKTFTENRFGTRTYVLWCYGAETYTAQINVNVTSGNGTGNNPSIRSLTSSKSQPLVNENFFISWDAINVDSCTASGSWSGTKSVSGSEVFSFANTGTRAFTLACTDNATGAVVNKSLTVNVVDAVTGSNVQITSFTASPNPVAVGTNLNLKWTSANAVSCKGISPGISNWIDILPANSSINIAINEAGNKTFVLRCYEINNTSASVDASVTISTTGVAQPEVVTNLSVDKTSIIEGESVLFSWSSSNATSCKTVGTAPGWAGTTLATSGSLSFIPRHDTMSYSYSVNCSNSTSSVNDSVSIFVALPAQALDGNCAIPLSGIVNEEWQNVWPGNWPGPNSFKQTITLDQGQNLSIHLNSGAVAGVTSWLTSAPRVGTAGVRTATVTQCPGDFTYGQVGSANTPMDPDCTETWGVGTFLKFEANDTYTPNNGICEMALNTDYYLNIRYSSACTTSICQGVFDYTRAQ